MNKDIRMILNPYLSFKCSILLLFCFVLGVSVAQAQNTTETRWYFGNSPENLVFDRNGRDVYLQTDQATPFGNAGAVTITDQFTGNLLFYTDGTQVFDASHTLTPNGTGLIGDPSINVPVVSAPVTGSLGQYYLFTNPGLNAPAEIQYTIVDATLDGNGADPFPLGDVDPANLNQPTGLTDPSEAMLIIPLGDGETFWLITQDRNTFEIRVTELNDTGIAGTVNYDYTDGSTPGFNASHFAYNQDSSWLAMAPQQANRNIWMMFFNPINGTMAFGGQLVGTGFDDGANEAVYDLEWSNDGSKLYFSRFGGTGDVANLYHVDFADTTINTVFENPINRSYGLKRAIDGRIYHLFQETSGSLFSLGRVNRPDSLIDSIDYQMPVFANDFNAMQFPEFTPAYNFSFDTLNFHYIDSCATNVTKFFPIVEPPPQNLIWTFGDGTVSNAYIPTYTYAAEGGYVVNMTAEVNGIQHTIARMVEIFTNDLMVNLGNDTTICPTEILTLDAGEGEEFQWSTGAQTQTIEVDTAGTYWVEVTNAAGCTGFDDIIVTEYQVQSQTSNQWYFGTQAGIDFTGGATAILDGNNMMAEEGCATISDVNGGLLFYTNGVDVWNKEHALMINGDSIGGHQASAQSAMIMPFNGDQTMFYIFTTESVYGDGEYALRYSIVDMKEDSARGEVIVKNAMLMDNSTERVTASSFSGTDFLLAHEFGNNTFRSYNTGAAGLSGAIYSPSGEIHQFIDELSATGYMKFSPTLSEVAVNIPGTNQVEIFDFRNGELSNPRLIDTGEADLYGMEFSGAGIKLYLTTSGASSKLIQYDLDSLNSENPAADIQATKFDGYTTGPEYGALQMGPDGTIYMAINNAGTIGTITNSNGDNDGAGFNAGGFDLQGRTSQLGLPNFSQNQSTAAQVPSISVTTNCAGQESSFSGTGRDTSIEEYLWIFGDGQSAVGQNATHTYAQPGTYTVQLELSNRCDVDTILTQTIEIFTIPEQPTVPPDTVLCDQPIVLSAWDVDTPDFSYYWSTGDTTRQITVGDPNIIDVAIIDNTTGCSSDTLTVFIAESRPTIDLGTDLVLCQNDPTITLDSQIPGNVYAWSIDGVLAGSNRTFDVITSTAGTFEYTVAVTNSFSCIGRDTLQVTIQPEPDIGIVALPTSGCGLTDGDLIITFNDAGSYSYQISGPVNVGATSFDGPGTDSQVDIFPGGNYTVTTTNIVTGCVSTNVVQVEDPGTLGLSASAPSACIGDGAIDINFTSPPTNFEITIDYEDGSSILNTTLASPVANPVVSNLDTGTYFISVRDVNAPNCVETETVTISLLNPLPAFTFDAIQEVCGTQGDILVTDGGGGATYTWTGPGIVSGNPGETITVDQAGTYTVTADGAGFCPSTESIEVVFNNDPVVDVVVGGDPCEGQVILNANVSNGSGTYLFDWTDGSQAQQNTVNTSGTYTVTVTDQLTSCSVTSSPVDVTIQENFEVVLSIEPDCENNGNVFLIATTNYFDPSITYQWQNSNADVLAETDSILTVTLSDRYTVTATNESGTCSVSASVDVAVVPIDLSELILPKRATFCSADAIDPQANLDPGIWNTYEWRLLPDEAIISTDPTISVNTEGIYTVTLFNGFTCTTDTVNVVEDCRPIIHAPNAFSPNGNDTNEEFFVFPNDYVDAFEIFIYSRWGELVFYSNVLDFRWDGIYRGRLLPVGTYAYVVKFSSTLEPELGTLEQYGSVTLIR